MNLHDAAIAYAKRGRMVFPCAPRGKEPFIGGGAGFLGATCDLATVDAWWGKWPNCNIGMACAPSGFFVVDIDPRNGGAETWHILGQPGMPDTREAETGSGGWHFLYKLPELPAGRTWKGSLGPGVDLKVNGYIIVAPSIHPNGRPYNWANAHGLAEAPQWLLDLSWHEVATTPAANIAGMEERAPWFCRAALVKECERVSSAPKGERNRTLNSAAFNLGGLVGLGLERELIEERLMVAAHVMNDLPLAETRKTIRSGVGAGMKRPRGIPAWSKR